jgi:NAD(P)-dependent dehydrogenase (short-subunit alcohol dehydrogenase family)
MDLSGRKALVTGGAGHIGACVSETLAELGASVGIVDVDESGCEKCVEWLSRLRPGCARAVPCDLADERATRAAVRNLIAAQGGLDIIVHCAAYVGTTAAPGWAVPFEQQTVEAWEAAMRVNLTSAFVIVQEAKTALEASAKGSVILMGSIYGLVGPDLRLYEGTAMSNPAGYAASKGGLLQLVRYLASVLAPRVRVNAISPGGVWRSQPEVFHDRYVSRTPMKRMATEEDVKGAVAYLASDLSAYVTGHNVIVDGGWTAW